MNLKFTLDIQAPVYTFSTRPSLNEQIYMNAFN